MSHITIAQQGLAALDKRDWDDAVTKLTTALKQSPNPAWLIGRSKALIATGHFREALEDADLAWHTAFARNKRDLMIEAHYRRAVAYFRLGQYANSDCCCVYAMRLAKGLSALEKEDPVKTLTDESGRWKPTLATAREETDKDEFNQKSKDGSLALSANTITESERQWRRASTFRLQPLGRLDKLSEDDPARIVSTAVKPVKRELSDLDSEEKKKKQQEAEKAKVAQAAAASAQPAAVAKPQVPSDTPVRLQDFQNDSTMSVTIFSKGVNKEKLKVEFLPFSVRLDPIIHPSGEEKEFGLELWGEIDTESSKYTVTPSKVELSLKKKTPGKWSQLRGEGRGDGLTKEQKLAEAREQEVLAHLKEERKKAMDEASKTDIEEPKNDPKAAEKPDDTEEKDATASAAAAAAAAEAAAGPAYPTSSRSGPKDWDKLAEADSDEEESDVNQFFKKLYKNATPEQQRAMMKSFTESSGTSLSTDWDDVKARTVEAVPPEGAEAKKWSK